MQVTCQSFLADRDLSQCHFLLGRAEADINKAFLLPEGILPAGSGCSSEGRLWQAAGWAVVIEKWAEVGAAGSLKHLWQCDDNLSSAVIIWAQQDQKKILMI